MRNINKMGYRIIAVFLVFTIVALISFWRVYLTEINLPATRSNNGYVLNVGRVRGTVFDRNLLPLTNNKQCIIAAVLPTPRAITAISSILKGEELQGVLKRLQSGKPALVELTEEVECEGIICLNVYKNSNDANASHLIGYTDSTGHGVAGVQKAYDDLLYSDDNISIFFPSDANERLLVGEQAEITYNDSVLNSGVALTIDRDIQTLCEKSMQVVKSGAAVIVEVGSGKIRAMVSKPNFNPNNIAQYLDGQDSPLVNKALSSYNVGSIFKPCVAAALLEQNIYKSFVCDCRGSVVIDNHTFACHDISGHGRVNLSDALRYSCNSFFYTVSQKIGADSIYNMARSLNFGSGFDLGRIYSPSGSIDSLSTLKSSKTSLANLSIGQGRLLLSPVSVISLYQAIADGGQYYAPTVVEGRVDGGVLIKNPSNKPTRVMSESTADSLKRYLIDAVNFGTGIKAKPELCTAAGKTATAQTGIKKQGKSIENSWFCGFFPAENPKYAVAILIEDEDKNGTTGAPIFKLIADCITDYENAQKR